MQPYDVMVSQKPGSQERTINLRIDGEIGRDFSVAEAKELVEDLKEMIELHEELEQEDAQET